MKAIVVVALLSFFRVRKKEPLLEKGSFQKSPFSRDFREFRDSLGVPDVCRERRCLQTSPEQLKATKDKKDQKLEFLSPGGSGVSR